MGSAGSGDQGCWEHGPALTFSAVLSDEPWLQLGAHLLPREVQGMAQEVTGVLLL